MIKEPKADDMQEEKRTVHLYRSQFFYPFSLPQGAYQALRGSDAIKRLHEGRDKTFMVSDEITPHAPDTFSENRYFHPHARKLLFERDNKMQALTSFNVSPKMVDNWWMHISMPPREEGSNPIECKLALDWVQVMLYDLDVGVLSFGASWDAERDQGILSALDFRDVLDINNLLRRSAPSFVDFNQAHQWRKDKETSNGKDPYLPYAGWAAAQKMYYTRELPFEIKLLDACGKPVEKATEDFGKRFDDWVTGNGGGEHYVSQHFNYWLEKLGEDLGEEFDPASLTPILDERNFVCSLVAVNSADTGYKIPDIKPGDPCEKKFSVKAVHSKENLFGDLEEESDTFRKTLYQFLFADPATTVYSDNPRLRDRLLAESLYLRFRDSGSYYGFTRYSGMYMTHGDWFAKTIFQHHFNSMYFQMANLLLVLRAGLLDLSRQSAELARLVNSPEDLDRPGMSEKVEELRGDFLKFHNKYWFNEVTAQEQGIEIFDLWNRQMGNDRLFEEVEQEIRALHEFSQATVSRRLGVLTYLNLSAVAVAILALFIMGLGVSMSSPSACSLFGIGFGALLIGSVVALGLLANGRSFVKKWFPALEKRFTQLKDWVKKKMP